MAQYLFYTGVKITDFICCFLKFNRFCVVIVTNYGIELYVK